MKTLHEQILDELYLNAKGVFNKIDNEELKKVVSLIIQAKKIYVLGIGHSGMFGRILSMKLNHAGLRAYTVFDEINPPFENGDLFIAISQSGETKTILALAQKAKNLGGKVFAVTSNSESTLAEISETILEIEKTAEDIRFSGLSAIGNKKNQNLLGCLFGFNIYILFYTLVIMIAHEIGETAESINRRHANLQ